MSLAPKKEQYLSRILNAFPGTLKNEVLLVANTIPFDQTEVLLTDGKKHQLHDLIHHTEFTVVYKGESLSIPYRLYFNEPANEIDHLSPAQQAILHCIYLRHHNGFVRQKHLENLKFKFQDFIVPHTLQLLGEYVPEIIECLHAQLDDMTLPVYSSYVLENPLYWRKIQKRMVSYWNCYHRRAFKLKGYIGSVAVRKIKDSLEKLK